MEILTVRLGSQTLGIPSIDVEQILHMVEITRLSHRDPGVSGMLNLHGDILLIADPRARLGLPVATPHPDQRLILIGGQPPFLLWVDEVEALEETDVGTLDVSGREEYPLLSAAATVRGRAVPVLDVAAFRPATSEEGDVA